MEDNGPGKYDEICTEARMKANAVGTVLMIIGGEYGSGFSVQVPQIVARELPTMLRHVADEIERGTKELTNPPQQG